MSDNETSHQTPESHGLIFSVSLIELLTLTTLGGWMGAGFEIVFCTHNEWLKILGAMFGFAGLFMIGKSLIKIVERRGEIAHG